MKQNRLNETKEDKNNDFQKIYKYRQHLNVIFV
jgi:hypothetical protein